MTDTISAIQIDEEAFFTLAEFVRMQGLERVVNQPFNGAGLDPARNKNRYSVVVFRSGVVLRCFVTGISHSGYLMVASASRAGRRYKIQPLAVDEIWQ